MQERREKEDVVADLEENEREELFTKMNLDERSRVINLANKHTTQMLDLIHREKIKYLKEGDVEDIEARYPRDPPRLPREVVLARAADMLETVTVAPVNVSVKVEPENKRQKIDEMLLAPWR